MNIFNQVTLWPEVSALAQHLKRRHAGAVVPVLGGYDFCDSLQIALLGSTTRISKTIIDRDSTGKGRAEAKMGRGISTSCVVLELARIADNRAAVHTYMHNLLTTLRMSGQRMEIILFAHGNLLVLQDDLNQFIRHLMPLPEVLSDIVTGANVGQMA